MATDCARQRAYWKSVKFARQLRAENLAAYNARLKEVRKAVSPQVSVPVVSHPENSGCLGLPVTPIVSEFNRHLTIESGNVNAAQIHSDLHELYAEEANSEEPSWLYSDELEFRKCLFNKPYNPYSDNDILSICSSWMKQGVEFPRCTGCRFARYCSKNCHVKYWLSHKQMCKAIQTLPGLGLFRKCVFK